MERIPEFNFPHFKPEIHNDKAGDQRVGKQQGALWDFKTKPCLLQLLLRRMGFTHESERTTLTQVVKSVVAGAQLELAVC